MLKDEEKQKTAFLVCCREILTPVLSSMVSLDTVTKIRPEQRRGGVGHTLYSVPTRHTIYFVLRTTVGTCIGTRETDMRQWSAVGTIEQRILPYTVQSVNKMRSGGIICRLDKLSSVRSEDANAGSNAPIACCFSIKADE